MKGAVFVALLCALAMAGCGGRGSRGGAAIDTSSLTERDCLVRAMYFESNRSSHDGLMAVGTVVMNRVDSQRFPNTICGVVSQHRQFAPGVVTQRLDPRQAGAAERAADAVLKGERYAPIGKAMHSTWRATRTPTRPATWRSPAATPSTSSRGAAGRANTPALSRKPPPRTPAPCRVSISGPRPWPQADTRRGPATAEPASRPYRWPARASRKAASRAQLARSAVARIRT